MTLPMKIYFLIGLGISLLLLPASYALNSQAKIDAYPFTSTEDAHRFQTLTESIRCVVCQNQTIADSYAPLANDLRDKVYQMVLARKSNEEIQQYLVKRYGDFILLEPRLSKATLLLWSFPLIGLVILILLLRRSHHANKMC